METALNEAAARVQAYVQRRERTRGLDIESIHGFEMGPDGGLELRLSDIRALLGAVVQQVEARRHAVFNSGVTFERLLSVDGIIGPLTDAQRSEARTLYSNLQHIGREAADYLIRHVAVCAYVNGSRDAASPSDDASSQQTAERRRVTPNPHGASESQLAWRRGYNGEAVNAYTGSIAWVAGQEGARARKADDANAEKKGGST